MSWTLSDWLIVAGMPALTVAVILGRFWVGERIRRRASLARYAELREAVRLRLRVEDEQWNRKQDALLDRYVRDGLLDYARAAELKAQRRADQASIQATFGGLA